MDLPWAASWEQRQDEALAAEGTVRQLNSARRARPRENSRGETLWALPLSGSQGAPL